MKQKMMLLLFGKHQDKFRIKTENSKSTKNLQNSLSFLQVQDGALKTAGKILIRMGEPKTQFEAPTFNQSDKGIFDEEFKELQIQLKKIRNQNQWS